MMPRRDSNLRSTFSGAHKLTTNTLEAALNKHMRVLSTSNAYTIGPFLPGGTLEDLAAFGARNSAAAGFLLHHVFHDIFISSNYTPFVGMDEMCACFRECTYTLLVSYEVSHVETLQASFDSDVSVVVTKSGGGSTRTHTQFTGYGTKFNLVTKWVLKPPTVADGPTFEFKWHDTVVVEPKRTQRFPITVEPPAAQEFNIGPLLSLLHARTAVACNDLGIPESSGTFPRRNPRVQEIEAALEQVARLVDWHTRFLSSWFAGAVTRNSKLDMPWSLCCWKRNEDAEMLPGPADIFGADLATALREHHQDERDLRVIGLGASADLLQSLLLMRSYAAHFVECYAGIDHVMVRCFLQGIGAHNAVLFEQSKSLDALLMKIGKHQMKCAGIKTKAVGMRSPGCSIRLKIELAEQRGYFQPLEALPCVDDAHEGRLCFDGASDEGIPTEGTSTRYVFTVPAESTMAVEDRPQIVIEGKTLFENVPVMLVIGQPDGAKTVVRAAFLFVDMWCMRQTVGVSFIPSNKAFADAVAVLPPEMADFASAIRSMDVATSGLCLEIVELRGALADAIGVQEDDLAGDSSWMRQLILLMRGGASLQSLSKKTHKKKRVAHDFVEVDSEAAAPAYDLAKIKAASQKLYDAMIAQGKVDHYKEPEPDPEPEPEPEDDGMVYRSCGSSEPSQYRSLSAAPAPAASAPAPAAAPPQPMAVDSNNTGNAAPDNVGDGSVDALAGDVEEKLQTKDVGVNFMQRMLDALDHIPEPMAAVGAKIELTDPVTHCLFAKGKCPDGVSTNDQAPPPLSDFKPRADLDASTDSLVELLSNCTKPIPTQRMTLFGVGCIWESNALTALMSGGRDPSKVQLEIAQAIAPMQAA